MAVATVAWFAYVLAAATDAGITVPALLVLVWGGVAVIVLWVVWAAIHWLRTRSTQSDRWPRLYVWGYPVAVLLLGVATWSGAAFWLRFLVSKPALDDLVQSPAALDRLLRDYQAAVAARRLGTNSRVGLLWVKEAEVLPSGVVRLITTDCMFDHCGVVYSPRAEPPRLGEDHYSPLIGGWWHWWRSW